MDEQQALNVVEQLAQSKFRLGNVEFAISRMPVTQQEEVLRFLIDVASRQKEEIPILGFLLRHEESISAQEAALLTEIVTMLFALITKISPDETVKLRNTLFAKIQWRKIGPGEDSGYQDLLDPRLAAGHHSDPVEEAFSELGVTGLIEVQVRAIFVNFYDSFAGLVSRFQQNQTQNLQMFNG